MEVYILTGVMDIFFIVTLHILAKKVLGVRVENRLFLILGWCGYFFCLNLLSYLFIEFPLVNGICSLCIMLIVFCCLYDGKMQNKFIIVFSIVILGIISEAIVGFVYVLIGVDIRGKEMWKNDYICIGSIISKLINFIFVRIIVIISKTTNQIRIRRTEWAELFVVPVGSLIIFYVIAWDNNFFITIPEIVTFTVLLIINILSYYVYQRMQMQTEKMLENELLKQQSEYYKARYEDAEKQWSSLRKIRHDMKNDYVLQLNYLENQRYEELRNIYEKVLGKLTWENNLIHTGNIGIDSIVNVKTEMAREMNITVNSKADVLGKICTDHGDMNILFGNLFDNAIEAVSKMPEGARKIDLKIRADETAMLIEMGNSFAGIMKRDAEGGISTTKEDRNNHGLGIKLIKKVVDKYHGMFEINTSNDYFAVKIFLYYIEI